MNSRESVTQLASIYFSISRAPCQRDTRPILKHSQLEAAGFCSPLKQQPETPASGLLRGRAGTAGIAATCRPPRDGQCCSPLSAAGRRSDRHGDTASRRLRHPVSTGFSSRRGNLGPPGTRGMPAQDGSRERDRSSQTLRGPLALPFPKGTAEARGTPRDMGEERSGNNGSLRPRGRRLSPHASAPGTDRSPAVCSPGSEWSWCPDRWSPRVAPAPSGPTRP